MNNTVPEYWETATAEPPHEARPLGWLLVLPTAVGMWFVPRHLGPRIARSSIFKAIFVHLASLLITVAVLALSETWPALRDRLGTLWPAGLTLSEQLRLPAVLLVEALYELTDNPGGGWMFLASTIGIHAGCWLAAWLLMPLIAAGERSWRAYWRAAKLVLWSTSSLILLAGVNTALHELHSGGRAGLQHLDRESLTPFCITLWLLFWLRVMTRLGARYPGPAEGPGWAPRRPLCTSCGYVLTGLPMDGRCPECGLAVARSLPATRVLPAWALATNPWSRLPLYFGTAWTILRRPRDFFRTLAVHQGRDESLRFAVWSCWLAGLWTGVFPVVIMWEVMLAGGYGPPPSEVGLAVVIGLLIMAPVVAYRILLALLALAACRFGWRDPRAAATTTGYAAALFLPAVFLAPVCALALSFALDHELDVTVRHWPGLPGFWYEIMLYFVLISPPLTALGWGLLRYARALAATRHATA